MYTLDTVTTIAFALNGNNSYNMMVGVYNWNFGKNHTPCKNNHIFHPEMFIGWSYTRFLFLALIGNPTWLPGPIMCSDWLKF